MRRGRGHAGIGATRAVRRRGRHVFLGCALAAAILAGCTPQVHVQGHVSSPDTLAEIEPGVQTRAEVARLLGTPSAVATFDDKRWYYISRRTETTAFYDPELIDQQVTVITFDENDVVAEIVTVAADEARAIEPVEEESPTRGGSFGILEQLLGNIGRPAATPQQ